MTDETNPTATPAEETTKEAPMVTEPMNPPAEEEAAPVEPTSTE